jgi:Mg-chelatase subunit ChlD
MLPVFVFMAAMAVDVAWMQLVRTELRTATDAAARAGAKQLSASQNVPTARAAAIDAAARNSVAGAGLRIADGDVQFGSSTQSTPGGPFAFVAGGAPVNGVRVDGRRTESSLAGSVPLFFGRVMGVASFEPEQTAVSTVLDRDICLVLDRSGSMAGAKLVALKAAVVDFLGELDRTFPNEQVALASYSSTSRLDHELTENYAAIRDSADRFTASGLTAIGRALQDGIRGVTGPRQRPFAIPTIVLMTDGNHNTGIEPIVPAREASRLGIVVHTITFGGDADFRRMRDVANETGGIHFHADTAGDLSEIFRTIARTLPVLITQ